MGVCSAVCVSVVRGVVGVGSSIGEKSASLIGKMIQGRGGIDFSKQSVIGVVL